MKNIKEQKYVARQGARFNDNTAIELGEYLASHKLELNNYKAIYNDAKDNESSPFRNLLEWDSAKAADGYRLGQVREIVQHISIEIIYEDEELPTILPRAFEIVSKFDNAPQELIGIVEGLSQEDTYNQILTRAFSNLDGWWKTYQNYKEFNQLQEPIDQIRNELINKGIITH